MSDPLINPDVEMALLGNLMQDNQQIDRVADIIEPHDFADPVLANIFAAIVRESMTGKPATPITLRPYFENDEGLKALGGAGFLMRLSSEAGMVASTSLAAQIFELAKRRAMRAGLATASEACADMTVPLGEIVTHADAAISLTAKDQIHQPSGGQCFDELLRGLDDKRSGVTCGHIEPLDDLLGPMRPKQLVIGAGRPGMGKAQPLDARILTRAGWRTMGSLSVGDELASVDGAGSTVIGIFPQGQRQVYCVTLSDGRSTECCGEHLWKVRYREWDADRILSTDQIREMLTKARYRNRLSIDLFGGDFGSAQQLPLDPWLLGFLLGDGSICGGQVRFSTKDPEIVEAVSARLPADLIARYAGGYDYKITGGARGGSANSIMDTLRGMGIYETRSHDKFIPQIYLDANREARVQLLRGLMDSDGWAETKGAIRFSTASSDLAEGVCELIRSIGGVCSIRSRTTSYTYKGEKRAGRVSYTCRIRLSDPAEVFTLQRKIDRVGRTKNTVRLNISRVDPVRVDQVQCISVSHPSRLYVTDGYIVTHNTALALSYALGAAKQGHGVLYVSLEMSSVELAARMAADLCFSSRMQIPFAKIRDGNLSRDERRHLAEAGQRMHQLPFQVVDVGSLNIGRLNMLVRRHARAMAAKGFSLDLVIVDYLQLLSPDSKGRSTYEAVSEVSRGLKALAKDNELAVFALAQLSRTVETRPDKRPQLSDLRDSGQIEQDADAVLFLMRQEYYLRQAEPEQDDVKRAEWEIALREVQGQIEFIVAKRRNGVTGSAKGAFHGAYQAVRGME